MPHFDAEGREELVCQKGGHVFTGSGVWVERDSELSARLNCYGNVCNACISQLGVNSQRGQNMPTVTFTKEDFEQCALPPTFRGTNICPWKHLGIVEGEHAYEINLGPGALCKIHVRSSVRANNQSAPSGRDSIRAWLTTLDNGFVGSKSVRWVDRRRGWAARTMDMIETLANVGLQLKRCPKCNAVCKLFKTKKPGKNFGRWFLACKGDTANGPHADKQDFFEWTEVREESAVQEQEA